MQKQPRSRTRRIRTVFWYLVELLIYAVFIWGYYWVVLHALGGWLKHIFDVNKPVYAALALAVIITQAVGLELVTTGLFKLLRGRMK